MARQLARSLAVATAGLFLVASPAAAEWHFVPMAGTTFNGNTSLLVDWQSAASKRHKFLGGAVTLVGDGIFGVEAIGVWAPGYFQTDDRPAIAPGDPQLPEIDKSSSAALMANVVLTAPRRLTEYNLRPYVSAGYGMMRATVIDVSRLAPFKRTYPAFNVGGGAVGFFSQRTGVRFDLRYYHTRAGSDDETFSIGTPSLRYMTASLGVVIRR